MAAFLRDQNVLQHDIIIALEPWKNPMQYTTHNPVKNSYHLVYGTTDQARVRVCIFISKRISLGSWKATVHNRDLTTITINTQDHEIIHIHAVYNPGATTQAGTQREEEGEEEGDGEDASTLPSLAMAIQGLDPDEQHHHLIMGDFNLHHGLWFPNYRWESAQAKDLIRIIERHNLQLGLPAGTVTFPATPYHADTCIDLVLMTPDLYDRMVRCFADEDMSHDSDHLAVVCEVTTRISQQEQPTRYNWEETDNAKFRTTLKEELQTTPPTQPQNPQAVEQLANHILQAMQRAVDASTPIARPSSYTVQGFNQELKEIQMHCRRTRRWWKRSGSPVDWEFYRQARNLKKRTIAKALKQAHRDRVTEAVKHPSGLWKLSKWANNRQGRAIVVPPLQYQGRTSQNYNEKVEALRLAFFPTPPAPEEEEEEEVNNNNNQTVNTSIELPAITIQEIERAIRHTAPNKAPGPTGIPNRVLKLAMQHIVPYCHALFNGCLEHGYSPTAFRQTTTVVIRKANKSDYTQAKAYRPIALMETLGKLMDSILAERLSYLAEKFGVLPRMHCGARKRVSSETAMHLVHERIKSAWKNSEVATLACFDVAGAFDNVYLDRLRQCLLKRRVEERTVNYITAWMTGRKTMLKLPETNSSNASWIDTPTGIPQGSPLSPILYLFYNADLLQLDNGKDILIVGYADDIAILVTGKTARNNCNRIAQLWPKMLRWSRQSSSKWAPEKTELIHFTPARTRGRARQLIDSPLTLIDDKTKVETVVQPQAQVRYLGLIWDQGMRWQPYLRHIKTKATQRIGAMRSIAGSIWGADLVSMRMVYTACVRSIMMYGSSVWWTAKPELGRIGIRASNERTLVALQREAMTVVAGAFKRTAGSALQVLLHIPPIQNILLQQTGSTYLRLVTGPMWNEIMQQRMPRESRRALGQGQRDRFLYQSPLELFAEEYTTATQHTTLEQILPFAAAPWYQTAHVFMAESPELAIAQHNHICQKQQQDRIIFYTDGSGAEAQRAAACHCPQLKADSTQYMGNEQQCTIYGTELFGINLALQMATKWVTRQDPIDDRAAQIGPTISDNHTLNGACSINTRTDRTKRIVTIFTDNQAAIQSTSNPARQSGQWIIARNAQTINLLHQIGYHTEVRWIPAHRGIPGNEAADQLARTTATQQPTAPLPIGFRELVVPKLTAWKKYISQRWASLWDKDDTGRITRTTIPVPTSKVISLHRGLTKATSSIIIQMISGKIGLNSFLALLDIKPSAACNCGHQYETAEHVVTSCKLYNRIRHEIWGETTLPPWPKMFQQQSTAAKAARLMRMSNRLLQFSHVEPEQFRAPETAISPGTEPSDDQQPPE